MASVKLTVMLMPTPSDRLPMDSLRLMPMPLVTPTMLGSLLESTMAMVEYQAMVLLETVDIMAMEGDMVVSMVVDMVVTMASVKLTVMLMPTPLDRLPMDSLRLMPMPLVTPTMLESLLESTMAMVEYQAMVLLETVKLTVMLMPTPSDRLLMVSLRLMPMPLVTHTTLESLLELIMAMVEYLDMVLLVTEDTSAPLATVDTHTMAEQFSFEVINVFSAIIDIIF